MNHWLTWLTVGLMLGLSAMQAVYVLLYLRFLKRDLPDLQRPTSAYQPAVAVVLCLRGADPSLHRCLAGLSLLDYPDYELHLVFDDLRDPSIAVVDSFLAQAGEGGPPVHRHIIADRGDGCSLKCSALISTIMKLEDRIEVVALVDADASVREDWLKRLIAPLRDPKVGASTGNRWFAPTSGVGSMVRKIWNAAALPQMCLYRIAWGGSLALRVETIEQCELLDRWSVAFCEDTMLTRQLAERELAVVRVPDLIVVNRESTTLRESLTWIGRQLLTVRLYHSAWIWILVHALFGALCLFGPPLIVLFYLITIQWWAALIVAGVWITQQLVNQLLIQMIELANWTAIKQGQPENRESGIEDPGLICTSLSGGVASVILQLLYPFLAIGTTFRQRVRWRGVDYRIGYRSRIELIKYRRFADIASEQATGTDRSIG